MHCVGELERRGVRWRTAKGRRRGDGDGDGTATGRQGGGTATARWRVSEGQQNGRAGSGRGARREGGAQQGGANSLRDSKGQHEAGARVEPIVTGFPANRPVPDRPTHTTGAHAPWRHGDGEVTRRRRQQRESMAASTRQGTTTGLELNHLKNSPDNFQAQKAAILGPLVSHLLMLIYPALLVSSAVERPVDSEVLGEVVGQVGVSAASARARSELA